MSVNRREGGVVATIEGMRPSWMGSGQDNAVMSPDAVLHKDEELAVYAGRLEIIWKQINV